MKSCFAALGIFLTGLVIGLAILWIPSAVKNAIMPWETKETSHTTQIIEAVTREEQISLLRLGILGEEVKDASTTFYGKDLPWSEKTKQMRYSFNAKLGFNNSDVTVEANPDDSLTITVPEFIFIGIDDQRVELSDEENGLLSWFTPDIDETELVNGIVDDELKKEYLQRNDSVLREQTQSFYSGIINGIDPDVNFELKFH